jgi:hypothetical protein
LNCNRNGKLLEFLDEPETELAGYRYQMIQDRKFFASSKLLQGMFCLGLIAIAFIITVSYVSQERTFYSWDYARYANRVSLLADTLRTNPLKAFLSVLNSLGDDYSLLPILPILPFTLLLGDSRLTFITALVFAYGVPFCLLMGTIATQLIRRGPTAVVFWSTVFLSLLLPPLWFPIFRGYPDLGGTCLVLWGITLYWKDNTLQRRGQIWQIAGVLAIAVYFRRHFAYSVRAFILAVVLYHLAIAWPDLRRQTTAKLIALAKLYRRVMQLVAYFVLFAIIIFVKTLFLNYRQLYAAYEVSPMENLQYFGQAFGWLLWGLAIVGYGIGLRKRSCETSKILFFLLFSVLSILQWFISSKQIGPHYTTHFIPLIVLGLAALIAEILNQPRTLANALLLCITGSALGLNLVLALVPKGTLNSPVRRLFAANEAPFVRKDYQTFSQLVKFLRERTPAGESIYIASSSYSLNSSNVLNAEQQLYGSGRLSIFKTSDVDSRDYYPLNALLSANYVVVANPPQFHLAAKEQDLVRVVVDAFNDKWDFTRDFQKLPIQFQLDGGITVEVYQRIRKTSEQTIVKTLQHLLARVVDKPGREPYWLSLNSTTTGTEPQNKQTSFRESNAEHLPQNQPQRYKEHRYSDIQKDPLVNTVHISGIPVSREEPQSFLYFGTISPKVQLVGTINRSKCKGLKTVTVRLSALRSDGYTLQEQQIRVNLDRSPDLDMRLPASGATYLRLNVFAPHFASPSGGQSESCRISLNHLALK